MFRVRIFFQGPKITYNKIISYVIISYKIIIIILLPFVKTVLNFKFGVFL